MKVSYEGIGQWAATFACSQTAEGQMVKVSGSGVVSGCAAGDSFCGQVLSVGRDGIACAVALGGMVTAGYTGTAPAVGWSGLSANGQGGVQADAAGRTYLVVDVDESGGTVTFAL
ncbi:hypothetical protein [uncultured Dysosmobacter sp.]|uniref:hypothetical protein n=1 Tax=uncultured Dysosmobacter sp. TaxID=2591384 RepID=UPI0026268F1C|nr:hypothetical protein [uncultured Dysosmobacter sp.]